MSVGHLRNLKCPCNSGKKYKKCHWPMPWASIRLSQVSLTQPQQLQPRQPLPSWTPSETEVTLATEAEIVK